MVVELRRDQSTVKLYNTGICCLSYRWVTQPYDITILEIRICAIKWNSFPNCTRTSNHNLSLLWIVVLAIGIHQKVFEM